MLSGRVRVTNDRGLHARAAGRLVRLASQFKSCITLAREDESVKANARSLLDILNLSAAIGSNLRLEVEGEDAESAFAAVEALFDEGFGEL